MRESETQLSMMSRRMTRSKYGYFSTSICVQMRKCVKANIELVPDQVASVTCSRVRKELSGLKRKSERCAPPLGVKVLGKTYT